MSGWEPKQLLECHSGVPRSVPAQGLFNKRWVVVATGTLQYGSGIGPGSYPKIVEVGRFPSNMSFDFGREAAEHRRIRFKIRRPFEGALESTRTGPQLDPDGLSRRALLAPTFAKW